MRAFILKLLCGQLISYRYDMYLDAAWRECSATLVGVGYRKWTVHAYLHLGELPLLPCGLSFTDETLVFKYRPDNETLLPTTRV